MRAISAVMTGWQCLSRRLKKYGERKETGREGGETGHKLIEMSLGWRRKLAGITDEKTDKVCEVKADRLQGS